MKKSNILIKTQPKGNTNPIIRINKRESEIRSGIEGYSLPMGALEAMEELEQIILDEEEN